MNMWTSIFVEPARTVLSQIGQFLVNVILVIIIFIVGWVISKTVKSLIVQALKTLKLDDLSKRLELENLLKKGGIPHSLSELIGVVFYWLALLVTFVVAVNAVGLTIAAELLNRVTLYIPHVIAAIFILILGLFTATVMKNIVQTAASNAGLSQGAFLAKLSEALVIIFAVLIALEELNIGTKIIELTISIILGAIGLALALSFGLGCKDIAAKYMADLIEKLKGK